MDRLISLMALAALSTALSTGLSAGASAQAWAAGILDPDRVEPVSRFGQYTDENGRLVGSAEQVAWEDSLDPHSPAADRSLVRRPSSVQSDRIALRASSRSNIDAAEARPLGTRRRNGVQEVALIAGDLGFFPRTIFVTRDIPVRLFVTGASKNALCIMMDSFNVRKQIRHQSIEEVSFTPERPGSYRFHCPINGAEGHVVVREFGRDEES